MNKKVPKVPHLSQTCINLLRAVRNQITLLNGIRASNEKNDVIDLWRGAYWLGVETGEDPQKLIQSVLEDYARRLLKEIIVEQEKTASRDSRVDTQKAIASKVLKRLK